MGMGLPPLPPVGGEVGGSKVTAMIENVQCTDPNSGMIRQEPLGDDLDELVGILTVLATEGGFEGQHEETPEKEQHPDDSGDTEQW